MVSFRALLFSLVLAALAAAGFLTATAMRGLGALGDEAAKVYVAKDVTADILPPPLYLIETRLIASQAVDGFIDLRTAESEFARLREEYEARAKYWKEAPPYGLERDLLGAQHDAAQRMNAAVQEQFLPALRRNNIADARAGLSVLDQLYREHRSGVDATVKKSVAFAADSIASFDAARGNTRRTSMVALLIAAAGLAALFMLLRLRLGRMLGAEPEAIGAWAQRLADGDLQSSPVDARPGSVADALERMRARLVNMLTEATAARDAAVAASEEIRARAEREAQMAVENARIRSALDSAASCVMMADSSGRFVYANDAARQLLRRYGRELGEHIAGIDAIGTDAQALGRLTLEVLEATARRQGKTLASDASADSGAELTFGAAILRLQPSWIRAADGTVLGTVLELRDRSQESLAESELRTVVAAAVDGDLTVRVEEHGKTGFFAIIAHSLNELMNCTETLVQQVKDSAGSIDDQVRTVAEGSRDLASRTERQAAGLEETAASMEQMTATVQQNSSSSTEAQRLAAEALEDMKRGQVAAQTTAAAVQEIGESSRRINDVVGVIDDLSFQTNLLALNAAVEAARAGEQGRGFAVVATEVRSLATRSAAAAKEIRNLIHESSQRVQNGQTLATESVVVFERLVSGVQRVAEQVLSIAAAGRQQSAGIVEIDRAVTDMDRLTQETAALVQGASSAAEMLTRESQAMREAISRYRTRATGRPTAVADGTAYAA